MTYLKHGTNDYNLVRKEIQFKYGVYSEKYFNLQKSIRDRIDYLKKFLKDSGRKAYVLGISGGVDSTLTGKLCQIAVDELTKEGYICNFIAMRLPANIQFDEEDAQEALKFIQPNRTLTVNVGSAANDLSSQLISQYQDFGGSIFEEDIDFHKGNIKARLRMIAQYHAAAIYQGLVVGTDHNAEGVMGFFALHGDGACDLTVLNGLNKRQIRLMAKELGASERIWNKPPTADLEELKPGKLDDEGFGFPYDYLDDFLEGKDIPPEIEEKIINRYNQTRFKRRPIPGFVEDRELS
jgi:NAD+ synthase